MKLRRLLRDALIFGGMGTAIAVPMAVATTAVFPFSPLSALAAGLGTTWIIMHAGITIGNWLGKRRRPAPTAGDVTRGLTDRPIPIK